MREHHGVILVEPSEMMSADVVEAIRDAVKRAGAKTVACIDRLRTLDYLPLEPLKEFNASDVCISFGGAKIRGFDDKVWIKCSDADLRRYRNKRKRRSRKLRGK